MKRKKGNLRTLAVQAKSRLKTNFWRDSTQNVESITQTINMYYGKTDADEEEFYSKIAHLITSGINPISHVLDRAYMDGLDENSRERYVLSIGARVRKCVERYHQVV